MFYLVAAVAFAVITVVCANDWALDSHVEDESNGFVKRFDFRKVSIFERLIRQIDHVIPETP